MDITTAMPITQNIEKMTFSWIDYLLFILMLGLSALIGVYYGCVGNQNTTKEYLLGGKTMKVFPVAMSLIAGHISGLTILAVPADVYKFGASYFLICFCIIAVSLITIYIYLPVFHKLELTSTYEYLNMRFDYRIRIFASLLFTIYMFLYNPVVIFIPALAFSQVTNIDIHLITPIVCIVCIFYTTIGGLKAVVWTDTLQFLITLGAAAIIFFLGATDAGGLSLIWKKSLEGQRLDIFDFGSDVTNRDGFWAVTVGGTFAWTFIITINQACVQRFLAVPTVQDAKKLVVIFGAGLILVKCVSVFMGLMIYAKYAECDPQSNGDVERHDQLLPHFVMEVTKNIPGLPGLFMAGVFSAGLSTLSSTLNAVAGTVYEDFMSPFMPSNTTEKTASKILKILVVIFGIIFTALVFVIEKLGGLLPLAFSFTGVSSGPMIGVFTLGLLFPFANATGALWGGITSLLISGWLVLGQQWYILQGAIRHIPKPISTEACTLLINATNQSFNYTTNLAEDQPLFLYRIAFFFYPLIGTVITVVVGLIVSWLTRKDDPPVHRDLLSPVIYFLLPDESAVPSKDYLNIRDALELVYDEKKISS